MLVGVDVGLLALYIVEAVGILEQTEAILGLKHTAACLVDVGLADKAFVESLGEYAHEGVRRHIHVGAGFEGAYTVFKGVAHAVVGHLVYRGIVGNYKIVEAPLVAEQILKQPLVGGGRHAVDDIERGHERCGSGVDCGLVGRQILVVHALAAHVYCVVVAAGLGAAVEGEVFDAGKDVLVGEVALIAFYHCLCYLRAEVRIFACTFGHTAPTGITGDVDHRAEGPVDTAGRGLVGGDGS